METNGFSKNADILQIAAKHGESEFSVYVQPTQTLKEEASAVHGLRYINGRLELHGHAVETVTLTEAIIGFYEFLYKLDGKSILTAHNCKFDYPRLIVGIGKVFTLDRFKSVVEGFCDTLPIIVNRRKEIEKQQEKETERQTEKQTQKKKEKRKGANKLQNLAIECLLLLLYYCQLYLV